jgi:hypothetical protein
VVHHQREMWEEFQEELSPEVEVIAALMEPVHEWVSQQ